MDEGEWKAAIEAQWLMGHCAPAAHVAMESRAITGYSWGVDEVRVQLAVPHTALWEQRIRALELHNLASFTCESAPVSRDAEGPEHACPGWADAPREPWGSVGIHPLGVLTLADLSLRPYVRLEDSPAVRAHWDLVQAESAARLHTPHDPAQWAREWPEQATLFTAWEAQYAHELGAGNA
jgi:hypothetical protein